MRDRVVAALASLEAVDAPQRSFYAERRSFLQGLNLAQGSSDEGSTAVDVESTRVDATRALERGGLDRLESLVQRILVSPAKPPVVAAHRIAIPDVDLASPFSGEVESRASGLGLRPVSADFEPDCAEYLQCCCAWLPTVPERPASVDTKAAHCCSCSHVCPPAIPTSLKETLDLLIVHPFIDSAGQRYLPRFGTETLLVEDFPETDGDSRGGKLLDVLGLNRRTAVSRLELEAALLRRGPEVVEDVLGLDLRAFRLVAIPFDLYSRLGAACGWGRTPRWTHFDGYQVWKAGRLRALVGGDVRYGGRHHLFSIGVDDERDEVSVRLAVVRRDRFSSGGAGNTNQS